MAHGTKTRTLPTESALPLVPDFGSPDTRASDADREQTVAILEVHWTAGRLSMEEFEARSSEVWRAQFVGELFHTMREMPVAMRTHASPTHGILALALGIIGLTLLVFSFGLFFILSLPFSITAWLSGRAARHKAALIGTSQQLAVAGEGLGIAGTVLGFLAFAGCVSSF